MSNDEFDNARADKDMLRRLESSISAMEVVAQAYDQLNEAMEIPSEIEFYFEVEDLRDKLLHWLRQNHEYYVNSGDHD